MRSPSRRPGGVGSVPRQSLENPGKQDLGAGPVIPLDYITEWRQVAPWAPDAQVEQDLVISRALVHLFQQKEVSRLLAFRGGTALYKLYLSPPSRYSEDIDLVQMLPGAPGPLIDAIRGTLDSWLGAPRRVIKEGKVALLYSFRAEGQPSAACGAESSRCVARRSSVARVSPGATK